MSKPPKVQSLEIPWRKVVIDADEDWARGRLEEIEYEFSPPGRVFRGNPYKRGPYKPRPYNNGRLNRTLARMQAQGVIQLGGFFGGAAFTFEPVQITATGHVPVLGAMSVVLEGLGVAATASVPATGVSNIMLDWLRAAEQFGPMWISDGVGRVQMKGAGTAAFAPMTSIGIGAVEGSAPAYGSPMGLLLAITASSPGVYNFLADPNNHATGAAWTRDVNSSWTASQADRAGGSTAELWTEHSGVASGYIEQTGITVSVGLIKRTIYVKQTPSSPYRILEIGVANGDYSNGVFMQVDPSGNVLNSWASGIWGLSEASCVADANGYFKVTLAGTFTDTSLLAYMSYSDGDNAIFDGDGASGWFIDDDQLVLE